MMIEKINNELVRTPYELTLLEFVSVRFSSLFYRCFLIFFSYSFMNQFIADSEVDFTCDEPFRRNKNLKISINIQRGSN